MFPKNGTALYSSRRKRGVYFERYFFRPTVFPTLRPPLSIARRSFQRPVVLRCTFPESCNRHTRRFNGRKNRVIFGLVTPTPNGIVLTTTRGNVESGELYISVTGIHDT